MELKEMQQVLGETFFQSVLLAAPDHAQLKLVQSHVQKACQRFPEYSYKFSLVFNLIKIAAFQQHTDQEQRLRIALGSVKLLKVADEIDQHYHDALVAELEREPVAPWNVVLMRREPARLEPSS